MNASNIIRRAFNVSLIVALALFSTTLHAALTPNLLVDPGFENPALTPFGQIIGPPFTTGVWGGENAANVTGPVAGISPAAGLRMHRMDDDGLAATQSWQLVDVTPYTAAITAGNASVNFSALFNVPANVQAGVGSIGVSFFDSSNLAVGPLFVGTPANVDSLPPSWQSFGMSSVPVPAATQYIRLQVAYANATMVNPAGQPRPGFVDDALLQLNIVPEPSSVALVGSVAGLAWLMRLRKRRSGNAME